jgi:chromosome segregation ATPase
VVARLNHKLKRVKKQAVEFQSDQQQQDEAIRETFESQQKRISKLKKAKEDLKEQITELGAELQGKISDIEILKEDHEKRFTAAQKERKEAIDRLLFEFSKEKATLELEVQSLSTSLRDSSNQIKRQTKELAQWRRQVDILKKSNKQKEDELHALESKIGELQGEWEIKVKQAKSECEHIIASLKSKNKELRDLCSRTNESVGDTEGHNRALLSRISELERTIQELKQRIDLQKEEIIREKQLGDTKSKAACLQMEMKCQNALATMKSETEAEKRKLVGFVIKEFKEFFDGRQQLSEDCFKGLVQSTSYEFSRLRRADASLRRLLGIGVRESVEDAVAKLLLDVSCQ